jgi:hypothetical protein
MSSRDLAEDVVSTLSTLVVGHCFPTPGTNGELIPNKELVDLVSEDVEGNLLVCGLIWHDAIVMLGVDELQNPANKVA